MTAACRRGGCTCGHNRDDYPQLSEDAGEWLARPALLVGRLDTTQLDKGVLKLHAFEVS